METDAELLAAWRTGDERAGQALVQRHLDAVTRFFRNKVRDGVEDLIQRTFLSVVEARDRVRESASFRAYLFQTARNTLYNEIARRQRWSDLVQVGSISVAGLDDSPSFALAVRQELRLLASALRSIPIPFQVALELHYWERLSSSELAVALDIPVGTVKSRLRRAKELLRQRVEELADTPTAAAATISNLDAWAQALRKEKPKKT